MIAVQPKHTVQDVFRSIHESITQLFSFGARKNSAGPALLVGLAIARHTIMATVFFSGDARIRLGFTTM